MWVWFIIIVLVVFDVLELVVIYWLADNLLQME